MTRPQPAPHSIDCPPSRSVAIPAIRQRKSGSRRFGREKMYSRYADLSERRSAQKIRVHATACEAVRRQSCPIIAASVAMANAVLFSQLLMSPGHTMDSNTAMDSNADQSVARGHCGVFVVRDFLRKSDVLRSRVIDRLARTGPSRHRARICRPSSPTTASRPRSRAAPASASKRSARPSPLRRGRRLRDRRRVHRGRDRQGQRCARPPAAAEGRAEGGEEGQV